MRSQIRNAFLIIVAGLAFCAGIAQAEEPEQKHFYQPGQGYEQEPEYKFSGVIRKMPASGMAGIWTIDTRLVLVTPMTNIKQEQGKVIVGASVEVKGVLRGIDFVALEIEVKG